jgi:hypothetical protein
MKHPADDVEVLYCATIVAMNAINKLDALAILALAVDSRVEDQLQQRPWIPLGPNRPVDTWAEIEIPKFGEPPPLAIDVYSTLSDQHAKLSALTVMAALDTNTGWNVRPDFVL